MDVPRFGVARNKKIRRAIVLIVIVLVGAAGTYGLSKLKPAAPSVERATLWPDKPDVYHALQALWLPQLWPCASFAGRTTPRSRP